MLNFVFFDTQIEVQIKQGKVTSILEKTSNLFLNQSFFNANVDLSSQWFGSFIQGNFQLRGDNNATLNNLFPSNNFIKPFIDNNDANFFSISESNNLNFSWENLGYIDENNQIQVSDSTITFHNFTMLSANNFDDVLTVNVTDNIKTNISSLPLDTDKNINQYKVDILFNNNFNITGKVSNNNYSGINVVSFNHLEVNSDNYNLNFCDITQIEGNGREMINRSKEKSVFTNNLSVFDNLLPFNEIDFNNSEITDINLQYDSNSFIKTPFQLDKISTNIDQNFMPSYNGYNYLM